MATPLLPPSALSAMSAAAASAARTRAVAAKSRDSGTRQFLLPSSSPLPSILPPLRKSLFIRLVVASMPPPLVLSTLPPLLNAHQDPVASCPLAPLFPFASHSPAGCHIVCVVCLCLASPFVAQPPHASIINPPCLFAPAGCRVAYIRTTAVLSSSTLMSVAIVIVVVSSRTIAIVVDSLPVVLSQSLTVMFFYMHACAFACKKSG